MAVTARAQVVIPYFSNLPEDVLTNTFHFENLTTATLQDMATGITPFLEDFYMNGIYAPGINCANYLQPQLATVNWYDLADPPPRPAIVMDAAMAPTETSTSIPPEVAVCCSFQGDPVAGVPQARRRGRLFLGGLNGNHMVASSATNFPLIDPGVLTAVTQACETLRDAVATLGHRWVIRSEASSANVLITNGWVDNAADTQRRRGTVSTLRTIWS